MPPPAYGEDDTAMARTGNLVRDLDFVMRPPAGKNTDEPDLPKAIAGTQGALDALMALVRRSAQAEASVKQIKAKRACVIPENRAAGGILPSDAADDSRCAEVGHKVDNHKRTAGQGRAVRALAADGKSEGPWVAMYQTEIVSDGSEGAEDGAMKDLLVGSTELEIVRDVSSHPIQGTALVEHAPQEPEAERDASSVSGGVLAGALAAAVGLAGAVAAAVTAQRRKQNARTVATLSPTIGLRSEDSSAELGQGTYGAPLEDNTGDDITC